MINEMINGIATKINSVYPNAQIEIEEVKQGLIKPCFIITPLTPGTDRKLCNTKYYDSTFMVQYIPENDDYYDEICGVIEQLDEVLELIPVTVNGATKQTRRIDTESDIASGVLNYKVRYADYYYKQNDDPEMTAATLTVSEKG